MNGGVVMSNITHLPRKSVVPAGREVSGPGRLGMMAWIAVPTGYGVILSSLAHLR